jgi:antitoxin YefM
MEVATMIRTTYSSARANLAALFDEVIEHQEVVIIQRRGTADVAMIAADELASLLETAHLLRSPANAQRLLAAYRSIQDPVDKTQTIAELRDEVGLTDNNVT